MVGGFHPYLFLSSVILLSCVAGKLLTSSLVMSLSKAALTSSHTITTSLARLVKVLENYIFIADLTYFLPLSTDAFV